MIIICNSAGQLCNRIKEFAHCIATGIEKNEKVLNITFYEYSYFLEKNNENSQIKYVNNNIVVKFFMIMERLLRKIRIISDNDIYIKMLNVKLVNNPEYYDWKALFRHQDKIIDYFRLNKKYSEKVEKWKDNISNIGIYDYTVGVHIRQGDYKEWYNGKFYYTINEYINFMNSLEKTITGNVLFIVSTNNDTINEKDFVNVNGKVLLLHDEPIVDMQVLSSCNYIMGPPSTFSWWAAFIGKSKYYTIATNVDEVLAEKFYLVNEYNENEKYVLYRNVNFE